MLYVIIIVKQQCGLIVKPQLFYVAVVLLFNHMAGLWLLEDAAILITVAVKVRGCVLIGMYWSPCRISYPHLLHLITNERWSSEYPSTMLLFPSLQPIICSDEMRRRLYEYSLNLKSHAIAGPAHCAVFYVNGGTN